jgi:hypothetical protein
LFPTSRLTQERRKNSTDELPTRRVKDLPSSFFVLRVAQFKKAKDFYTTSYLQGQWKYGKAKEAIESARAGLSQLGESVRKSRKEKKKTKEDKKVAPAKATFRVSLTKNSFFLVHEYRGSEVTRLG